MLLKRKILALVLAVLLAFGLFPAFASAASAGTVQVRIADTVERQSASVGGAVSDPYKEPFGVILPLTTVTIQSGDTMFDVLEKAAEANSLTIDAPDSAYGKFINGVGPVKAADGRTAAALASGDSGSMSGWMVSINDWFASTSVDQTPVSNGDVVELLYTCNYGVDLGADWMSTSTKVKSLSVTGGTLSRAFDPAVQKYYLRISKGYTKSVRLHAIAENKYNPVTVRVGKKIYKYTKDIPVTHGTVITITCGSGSAATVYTLTVSAQAKPITYLNLPAKATVYAGTPLQLASTIRPVDASNQKLSWSSSNKSIAYVDKSGKVTGYKAGTVTITAKATDGSGKKDTCVVTVKLIKVTAVKLPADKTVKVGYKGALIVRVTPYNASNPRLTWKSSKPSVVSVDAQGNIRAHKKGEATITATAKDGSGKKDTCVITVK